MTRAGQADRRYLDKARLVFEKMLSYANLLGLYAEEIGAGKLWGTSLRRFIEINQEDMARLSPL